MVQPLETVFAMGWHGSHLIVKKEAETTIVFYICLSLCKYMYMPQIKLVNCGVILFFTIIIIVMNSLTH